LISGLTNQKQTKPTAKTEYNYGFFLILKVV
jgi:hypothetical protein